MNILVAEDDPVSRAVLAKILSTKPEHRITLVEDGAAAWSLLDDPSRSFDVLFLDLTMPKVDGFELLKRIQQSDLLKSLDVVLCTAANDRATVTKAVAMGARHYLVKPCTEALVLAKLQQLNPASALGAERKLGGY
jgi:two-component system chemotaxis response regulator CheY